MGYQQEPIRDSQPARSNLPIRLSSKPRICFFPPLPSLLHQSLFCFLHLTGSSEGSSCWNSLLFTIQTCYCGHPPSRDLALPTSATTPSSGTLRFIVLHYIHSFPSVARRFNPGTLSLPAAGSFETNQSTRNRFVFRASTDPWHTFSFTNFLLPDHCRFCSDSGPVIASYQGLSSPMFTRPYAII